MSLSVVSSPTPSLPVVETNEPEARFRNCRIALAGNPNSGKTTLFNALTGLRYKVANYPGVTVEKKEGKIELENAAAVLFDLPGIYSLSGSSLDEKIASGVLTGTISKEPLPDLVVVVLDATNLERNLYLTTEIIDSGIPLIVALNMTDLAEQQGISVFSQLLSNRLDVPVIPIVAKRGQGLDDLRHSMLNALRQPTVSKRRHDWLDLNSEFGKSALKIGSAVINEKKLDSRSDPILLGCALLAESSSADSPTLVNVVGQETKQLTGSGVDHFSFEATARYRWINKVVRESCRVEPQRPGLMEKLDKVLTHKFWGLVILCLVMAFIFQSIFLWAEVPMTLIEDSFNWLSEHVAALLPEGYLKSLVVDGIIAGVGSIIVFVPQIAILVFFLSLLEDSGYLSRAAFLLDKVMRRFGLQGRSFIPLLSSFACAIPGILSTRTIPSWADRLATIMVAPLMSCSARLPVYAVLIGAFVPREFFFGFVSLQGLVLLSMYLLGIIGAAFIAWILKKTFLLREPVMFVMEIPPIRRPSLKVATREVYDRIKLFIVNAGTIILACSIVLWFLATFPHSEQSSGTERVKESYAGQLGQAIEPVIKPLGFNWEIGVGVIASFAAREVFVSSLATVYNLQDDDSASSSLITKLQEKKADSSFTTATALSLMVFYVFACQCMSTLAIAKRETGSWWWTGFMFAYMTVLAYGASFVTYELATHFPSHFFGGL